MSKVTHGLYLVGCRYRVSIAEHIHGREFDSITVVVHSTRADSAVRKAYRRMMKNRDQEGEDTLIVPRSFTLGTELVTSDTSGGCFTFSAIVTEDPQTPERATSDESALDAIARLMDGQQWDSDTLVSVAETVRATGRTVRDIGKAVPHDGEPTSAAAKAS